MIACQNDKIHIFPGTGDGVFDVVGSGICVQVGTAIKHYTKRRTVTGGVITEVFVDEAGVTSATLPVGSTVIPCSQVVYPAILGSSSGGGVDVEIMPLCDAGVVFLRRIVYTDGAPTAVVDTELDGVTVYVPTSTPSMYPCPGADIPVVEVIQVPDIPNGVSFVEDISPVAIEPTSAYTVSFAAAYTSNPLVIVNATRISPTTWRIEVVNESGGTVGSVSLVTLFNKV